MLTLYFLLQLCNNPTKSWCLVTSNYFSFIYNCSVSVLKEKETCNISVSPLTDQSTNDKMDTNNDEGKKVTECKKEVIGCNKQVAECSVSHRKKRKMPEHKKLNMKKRKMTTSVAAAK